MTASTAVTHRDLLPLPCIGCRRRDVSALQPLPCR